jgi:hypothetical protein
VVTEVEAEIALMTLSPKVQDTLTLFAFLVHSPRKLINGSLRPAGRGVQVQEVTGMDNTLRLDLLKEGANIGNRARVMLRNVSVRNQNNGVRALSIVLQLVGLPKKSAKPAAS